MLHEAKATDISMFLRAFTVINTVSGRRKVNVHPSFLRDTRLMSESGAAYGTIEVEMKASYVRLNAIAA